MEQGTGSQGTSIVPVVSAHFRPLLHHQATLSVLRCRVEGSRLSPRPAGAVDARIHLLAVRSAVVRSGHRARHHARPLARHHLRRQGARR